MSLRCSEVVEKFTSHVYLNSLRKLEREMSGQTVPADFSGHMLDLDEDEDLEVFTKVNKSLPVKLLTAPLLSLLRGSM